MRACVCVYASSCLCLCVLEVKIPMPLWEFFMAIISLLLGVDVCGLVCGLYFCVDVCAWMRVYICVCVCERIAACNTRFQQLIALVLWFFACFHEHDFVFVPRCACLTFLLPIIALPWGWSQTRATSGCVQASLIRGYCLIWRSFGGFIICLFDCSFVFFSAHLTHLPA